jgi:Ty3 transposon capsid-like protein
MPPFALPPRRSRRGQGQSPSPVESVPPQLRNHNLSPPSHDGEQDEKYSSGEEESDIQSSVEQEEEPQDDHAADGAVRKFKLGRRRVQLSDGRQSKKTKVKTSDEFRRISEKLRQSEIEKRKAQSDLSWLLRNNTNGAATPILNSKPFAMPPSSSSTSVTSPTTANTTTSPEVMKDIKKAVRNLKWKPSSSSDAVRVSTFLEQYENIVEIEQGTPRDMLQLIGQRLEGPAFEWYRLLPLGCQAVSSWDNFKMAMIKEYEPPLSFSVGFQRLQDCKKAHNETYNAHLLRFTRHVRDMEANSLSHSTVVNFYLESLDPHVAFEVRRSYRAQIEVPISRFPADKQNTPTLAEVCSWAASADAALVGVQRSLKKTTTNINSSASSTVSNPSLTPVTVSATTPGVSPYYSHGQK